MICILNYWPEDWRGQGMRLFAMTNILKISRTGILMKSSVLVVEKGPPCRMLSEA